MAWDFAKSAKMALETVQRIEPARPEEASEAMSDVIADLAAVATKLAQAFHPRTVATAASHATAQCHLWRGSPIDCK